MTRRRRSRRRPRGVRSVPISGQTATLARTAELIRSELHRRGADFAPVAALSVALGVTEQALRAAVDWSEDLGTGGPDRRPVVWWVDPAPLAAGFEPVCDGRRLTLFHLAAGNPAGRPLVISGRHLDPTLHVELDLDIPTASESGELGYALARLQAMSARWLTEGQPLFSLISRAWSASPAPVASSGRLHVHCTNLGERIATQFWHDNAPADRLELVVWADPHDGLVLVNVYPCITEHSIPEREDQTK